MANLVLRKAGAIKQGNCSTVLHNFTNIQRLLPGLLISMLVDRILQHGSKSSHEVSFEDA